MLDLTFGTMVESVGWNVCMSTKSEAVRGGSRWRHKFSRTYLNAYFSIELINSFHFHLLKCFAMATSLIDRVIGNEDIAFHIASFLCPRRNPSTLTEFYSNECFVSKV